MQNSSWWKFSVPVATMTFLACSAAPESVNVEVTGASVSANVVHASQETCTAFSLTGAKTSWFAAAVLEIDLTCPHVPVDTSVAPAVQCAFQRRLLDVPNMRPSVITKSPSTTLTILYQTYSSAANYTVGMNPVVGKAEPNITPTAMILSDFDGFITPDDVNQADIDAVVDEWNAQASTLDPWGFVGPKKMMSCSTGKALNGHDPCDTCGGYPRW